MNNKVKAILITGILAGLISLGCREQSPAPTNEEPTYLVMGKRFIYGTSQSYYIEYDLIGPHGEVVAQCIAPKADGTGCEKYKTMQRYAFTKDKTERFLVESYDHIGRNQQQDGRIIFENVPGVYLRIKSEGFWSDQGKTSDSPTDP